MAGGAVSSLIVLGFFLVRGLGLTTIIRYFTTFPLNHSPPLILSFFLSLCFFTASLIVDFYCISPTPEGATGPPSPTQKKTLPSGDHHPHPIVKKNQ